MVGRTLAVGEDLKLVFDPSRDVAVATNFVGQFQVQSTELLGSRAIRWMAAYDKKCNCFADAGKPIN